MAHDREEEGDYRVVQKPGPTRTNPVVSTQLRIFGTSAVSQSDST